MKKTIALILFVSISLIAISLTAFENGYSNSGQSYEDAQLTIEQTENQNPTQFLQTDATFRKNLVGKWVLEGRVSSSASIANYKDVVLSVNYFSKTNTLIGSEQHTIYEYLTPGKTIQFKIKSFGYKGTESVGIEVANASTIN